MHSQFSIRIGIQGSTIGNSIISSIRISVGRGGGIVGIEVEVGEPEEGMLLLIRRRRRRRRRGKSMGPGVNVYAVGHHDYVEYGIVE